MSSLFTHFFNQNRSVNPFTPKKITRIQDIENIALILGAKTLDLSHLNLKFLQEKQIIDPHWHLLSSFPKPSPSSQVIQLNFNTGLTLMGLPKSLIFREKIISHSLDALTSPLVIRRYIDAFPHQVYQSFTVNIQRMFNLPNQQNFLYNYLKDNLLSSRIIQYKNYSLTQADIHWQYQLERCQFNLRCKVGHLQKTSNKPDKEIPFLLFLGGFNYQIYSFSYEERQKRIQDCLTYLEKDYQTFNHLVENQFLG